MPSQKIRYLGQSIAYQDTFYLLNIKEETPFYVHANVAELRKSGAEALLEINASHEPSRFRAKLFIDFNHMLLSKENLHTGDTIRLFHKESGGYLTSNEKDVVN